MVPGAGPLPAPSLSSQALQEGSPHLQWAALPGAPAAALHQLLQGRRRVPVVVRDSRGLLSVLDREEPLASATPGPAAVASRALSRLALWAVLPVLRPAALGP